MDHEKISVYCVICKEELSDERILRKAVTCSPEHATELKKARRRRRDAHICRLCYQPSNEEERRLYKQWRKETQGLRDRGRPKKPKADTPDDDPRPVDANSELAIQ